MQFSQIFNIALLALVWHCLLSSRLYCIGEEYSQSQEFSELKQQLNELKEKAKTIEELKGNAKTMAVEKFKEEMKTIQERVKKLECASWPNKFERTIPKIVDVACKLFDPKNTGLKPKQTVPVPILILTTAKGTDQNYNMLRWFQDMRKHFINADNDKINNTPYEYVMELLADLQKAIELAKECEDKLLHQFIPEDKLDELIKQIQRFRLVYQANEQQRIPHRNAKTKKTFDEILTKIVGILRNSYLKKYISD